MTSYTPSANKRENVKYYAHAVYEDLYPVNQNDTFALGEFISSVNLSQALLINDADGTEVATSIALNVVTVTAVVSSIKCTLFAYGRSV